MYVIKYWNNFYKIVGNMIFAVFIISPLIGFLDGFGISLIIPLLSDVLGGSGEIMSKIPGPIRNIFSFVNFELTSSNIIKFIVVVICLKAILKGLNILVLASMNSTFIKVLRDKVVRLFGNINYLYYTQINSGVIHSTSSYEINKYLGGFVAYLESIKTFLILMGYVTILFASSWKASLVLVIIGLLFNVLFVMLNKIGRRYSIERANENLRFKSLLLEGVNFFKYLKATKRYTFFRNRLEASNKHYKSIQFKTIFTNGIPQVIQEPITLLMIFLLFIVNSLWLGEPQTVLLVILAVAYRASTVLSQFQGKKQRFYSAVGSIDTVEKLFADLEKHKETTVTNRDIDFKNTVQLDKLCFNYPDGTSALKSIDLTINKNETIAFVGPSGSGKSTLVDVLSGLLIPSSGQIVIDGVKYSNLTNDFWRKKIGYITQENIVFDGSVKMNISFTEEEKEVDYPKLEESLVVANAKEFVDKLKHNTDTQLGEKGIRLSGGQRQRISIAREIYSYPEILILDEATSALDSESEKLIQESIDTMKGKTTVIIIAHRLSTIRNVDKIYVLEEGEIIEAGTYKDLVKNDETLFHRLASLQELT